MVFSLNWFKNLLCLENWQHKHSVIFRNVFFIAYLTIAVVASKRLTDANSVKVLIPYTGPKCTPAFHSTGMQKCLSASFFNMNTISQGRHLHCKRRAIWTSACFASISLAWWQPALETVPAAHCHICTGRFRWLCFNVQVTLSWVTWMRDLSCSPHRCVVPLSPPMNVIA